MSQQIIALTEKVASLEIKSQTDLEAATELLSKTNKVIDTLDAERKKVTDPLNKALKEENARFQPYIKQGRQIALLIKEKMISYREDQIIKQEKIAARVAKGTMRVDTAVNKLATMNDSKSANTTEGSIKFRKKQQLKVTDMSAIPDEYFDLNESKLLKDLKDGKTIKGAEIETIEIPVNSR